MSDCEWDAPHDEARFCVTHECWAGGYGQTCPLADTRAEVEALRAQVQAVRDVCDAATAANDAYNQPLNEHERRIGRPSIGVAVATVDVSRILRALDGGDA